MGSEPTNSRAARQDGAAANRDGGRRRVALTIAGSVVLLALGVFAVLRFGSSDRAAAPGAVILLPDAPEKSLGGLDPFPADRGPGEGSARPAEGPDSADIPATGRILKGIVVDRAQGEALERVQLLVTRAANADQASGADPSRVRSGRSGARGAFRIEGLPAGALVLEARLPGFQKATVRLPEEPATPPREVVVEMSRVARVHGIVTGPDSRPLGGAVAQLVPADRTLDDVSYQGLSARGARTTSIGRFDIDAAEGTHRLAVAHASYSPWLSDPFSLEAAEVLEMDVRLKAGTKIYGVVTDLSGDRLPNAAIFAADLGRDGKSARSRSDATGEYEMQGLLPGRFEASVLPADWVGSGGMPVTVLFDVPPGYGPHRVDLIVDVGGGVFLDGRVLLADGSPVTSAIVQCVVASPRPSGDGSPREDGVGSSGAVVTDTEGRFTCGPLRTGVASIFVHASGADGSGPSGSASFDAELPAAGRQAVEFVWPAGVVTGSFDRSARGRPRSGIEAVRLVPLRSGRRLPSAEWRSELAPSEYEFRFDSVPDGTYVLIGETGGTGRRLLAHGVEVSGSSASGGRGRVVELGVLRAEPEGGPGFLHLRGAEGADEPVGRAEVFLRFGDEAVLPFAKWFDRPVELSFANLDPGITIEVRSPGHEVLRIPATGLVGTTRDAPFVLEVEPESKER